MSVSEGRQGKAGEALGGDRPEQPQRRKTKLRRAKARKGRVAVGRGAGAGPPGASLGVFPRRAARPGKLSLTVERAAAPRRRGKAWDAEGGGDPTGR